MPRLGLNAPVNENASEQLNVRERIINAAQIQKLLKAIQKNIGLACNSSI